MLFTLIFLAVLSLVEHAAAQDPTLDWLARDVERVESVREVKDVTRTFCHLAQFGRWSDMAALFADDGIVRVGNVTHDSLVAKGSSNIETWLRLDHGEMTGLQAGSLNTWLVDQPVTTLSQDGLTARARWLVLRLQGDGSGDTRISGGVFENEYAKVGGRWKISLMHYYPQFDGNYAEGWTNSGVGSRLLPIIPYHYTPDSAGTPILMSSNASQPFKTNFTPIELTARITRLNDEDSVRNLQHAFGFYVDRRMWSDAIDLFAPDAVITSNGVRFNGTVRAALERMGPENLSQGVLNEHNLFDTIVYIDPSGSEATTRGIVFALIGDTKSHTARWEFGVFSNRFIKDRGTNLWKISEIHTTDLVVANYTTGWGHRGVDPFITPLKTPPFLPISRSPFQPKTAHSPTTNLTSVAHLLSSSAAFDSSESISSAYGYFADDIRCTSFAGLHHPLGHKLSPGVGYYSTPDRIAQACLSRYSTYDPAPQRPRVPYHWRPQGIVHVSQDGKSVSYRARLLQFGTGNETRGGFNGVWGFNGGVYHDQMALETRPDGTQIWRLWSLTIDEFYWQSSSWKDGWALNPPSPAPTAGNATGNATQPSGLAKDYPPDLLLTDPGFGEREVGMEGGKPPVTRWPDIRRMWFGFRNPVSGRLPQWYSPGCVPCIARPEWGLLRNGYQEPPTGPSLVTAVKEGDVVWVRVQGGPGEPVEGGVVLKEEGGSVVAMGRLNGGDVRLIVEEKGNRTLVVEYEGSGRLKPGQTRVVLWPGL